MSSAAPSALAQLDAERRSDVLAQLLARHPKLREEAEATARRLLGETDVDVIARTVEDAFLDQPFTVIADRAGRQPGRGYVHEADAAWELLEENLEPFLEEIRGRARAGLRAEAVQYADGVLEGLALLSASAPEDCLIGWGTPEEDVDMLSDAVRRERDAADR